jgi:mono/diheme cytochrome c family protein
MAEEDEMTRALCSIGLLLFAGTAFGDQVADGAKLFGKYCATCHGESGEGSKKSPPLVGKNALPLDPPPAAKVRKEKFHTAKDVLDFISKNMPAKKPGSLKPEEYAAILAFDLKANGVDVSNKHIDAASAEKIALHP